MMSLFSEICRIDALPPVYNFQAKAEVLRLDLVHPVISGNKWFKLKEYVLEAKRNHKKTLISFGGAYSNHIVATAAAAKINGFQSIGIIRGEKPVSLSATLQEALSFDMQLAFVSREMYKSKEVPDVLFGKNSREDCFVIPEGGYGNNGMLGAAEILSANETESFTHILCAVGTGTTLAGLCLAAKPHQKIIGISALKNNFSIQQEVIALLPTNKAYNFKIIHDYHFGGYAKHDPALISFMNEFYKQTGIPTDFIYTAKTFFAAFDLMKNNYFAPNDKLLLVHTGGLQGNRSLKRGTLIFG